MRQQAAYMLSISLRVAIDRVVKSGGLLLRFDILKRDQLPGHQREVLSLANDVHAQRNLKAGVESNYPYTIIDIIEWCTYLRSWRSLCTSP